MKCLVCGSKMTSRVEEHDYSASGLPVRLLNVDVRRCSKCEEWEAVVPCVEELHALLAEALIRKKGRLVGAEIRFIRSWLGLSGKRLSEWVGVTPETVSRWENDKRAIGLPHERLLRTMAVKQTFFMDYKPEELFNLNRDPGEEASLEKFCVKKKRNDGWDLVEPQAA